MNLIASDQTSNNKRGTLNSDDKRLTWELISTNEMPKYSPIK
jgi:hypothetical protein